MRKSGIILGSAAMALSLFVSYPALSQNVDFGDDASRWANDGQCDDPRFEGPGASAVRAAGDEGHDATDCSAAFEAGTVTLFGASPSDSTVVVTPPLPSSGDIDFGDDSGTWANDGECDDPRFGGTLDSHLLADATDCRTAYEAGNVTFVPDNEVSGAVQPYDDDIDFGDDSGSWANDGECDDPRFGGTLESHRLADATDCRDAYGADPSIYIEGAATETGDIDFGDDSGTWANDGECDDPRFGGGLESHRLADATDCRAAYEANPSIYSEGGAADTSGIDFGDDSGTWANDGECDDPRFGGSLENHRLADATDCRAAYSADPSIYLGEISDDSAFISSIDFGDDSSDYSNNGICDDPRFRGPGSATTLLFADRLADATDCRALFAEGRISFNGVSGDPALAGVAEIEFGDDSSSYANNDQCDDPRFAGPGTDSILIQSDLRHDATDCRALFEAGSVYLAGIVGVGDTPGGQSSSSGFRINFGDDTGSHPNDGECDDPRFQGRGGAFELFDSNILGDASDCRAAYDAGTVTYNP